jgi:hypothetical protein
VKVVYRFAKGDFQLLQGISLIADQRLGRQQLSEKAVVFKTGFDCASIAFVFQLVIH